MFGCKHQWEEVGRTYTPPSHGAHIKNAADTTLRMAMFGVTNVEQQCAICGRRDFTSTVGKA